ncbi:MAG TPA: methyltransferase domain-containing protein [Mycobacteriales bacterium]|nr:methyltransferase domain-containing protein [Mycobacteriales bacterium]
MTTIANTEMAAAWDGAEGEHWAANAAHYERTADRLWAKFLAEVRVQPKDEVLDIGCGTGASTRSVARLAADGRVVGIDLSAPMLAHARDAAQGEGTDNVEFEQGDAQVHPFPTEAFDLAISSHGAMFFNDPVAAFTNIRSALRPGGRLALTAWRPLRENEWLVAIRTALAAGRDLPEPPPGMPGPFGLADADHVRRVLGGAGFTDVRVEPVDEPMVFGRDTDDAYAFMCTMGIVRGLSHDLDDEARTQSLADLRATIEQHATPDGVLFDSAAWLITARNGGAA